MTNGMPSAIILIADGTEEMEFTIAYDTLVRAGVSVTSVFVPTASSSQSTAGVATCSRGIRITPDASLEPSNLGPDKHDILVVPGGAKGAETMSSNSVVQQLVKRYYEQGKLVGMICAGSLAAQTSGLPHQAITSHPSVKEQLVKYFNYKEDSVVVSNNLITSRGPGTAFPFALTLVELLLGKGKREEIKAPMIFSEGNPF